MLVSGFSLVANAVRLDFPIREALLSILPLCDELIVNVGPSDDGTLELVRGLADPRLRIIEGTWEEGQGSRVLAIETQRALEACRGDWAIYIQADEVLHEAGVARLKAALEETWQNPRVEGLLVDFMHFYGNTDWIGRSRSWYRREVRAVRPGTAVRSFGDAQGFRIGAEGRKPRARHSGATYYHYGWARPIPALREKRERDNALYYGGEPRRAPVAERLPWDVGLGRFEGVHPALMRDWIAKRRPQMSEGFSPRRWDARRLALLASLGIERITGWRPFEFTNYIEI